MFMVPPSFSVPLLSFWPRYGPFHILPLTIVSSPDLKGYSPQFRGKWHKFPSISNIHHYLDRQGKNIFAPDSLFQILPLLKFSWLLNTQVSRFSFITLYGYISPQEMGDPTYSIFIYDISYLVDIYISSGMRENGSEPKMVHDPWHHTKNCPLTPGKSENQSRFSPGVPPLAIFPPLLGEIPNWAFSSQIQGENGKKGWGT